MIKDKIITLTIIILLTLFGSGIVYSKISQTNDIKTYSKALLEYKNSDYYSSYRDFGRVSLFSDIKPPALFRQARCATLVGDIKGAKRNYSRILFRYPYSKLYVVSEYNLAMLLYDSGDKSARTHFAHIIKYYPDTDYALASEYYIADIDMRRAEKTKIYWLRKNLKQKSLNHFLRYIKYSPDGRFSQPAINNIKRLGIVLSHKDNFIIADSYFKRELYKESEPYYRESPLNISWAKYAKTEFKLGNYAISKTLTENGLKYFSSNIEKEDMYEAIDNYISLSENKLQTINELLAKYPNTSGADYLLYLKANYTPAPDKYKIYETIYSKYPNSYFSAESLFKTFYYNITQKEYEKSIKLGEKHLQHFKGSDTSPAVMYWLGKIYENKTNKIIANSYYKQTISKYPDSYYSYRAYLKLNKTDTLKKETKPKPIVFPYPSKEEQTLAMKLAGLGDYDFVKELYKNDKFVESWVLYKQGDLTQSTFVAEKAMKTLYPRPKFDDVRWRLVYPIHYYGYIQSYKTDTDPMLILSIIREESHFNPKIESSVGALGLMQIMPATASELASAYGINNNFLDCATNIRLGSLYYSKIKKSLENNDIYAVMSYNSGFGNVNNWISTIQHTDIDDLVEKIPYPETLSYLKKVLRSYWCYSNIY